MEVWREEWEVHLVSCCRETRLVVVLCTSLICSHCGISRIASRRPFLQLFEGLRTLSARARDMTGRSLLTLLST